MSQSLDDVAFVDQADEAFVQGKPQQALRLYAALLEDDPEDLYLWFRTAVLLGRIGDRDAAIRSLDLVARHLSESGQLLLSLAAAKELNALDPVAGAARLKEIATLHGSGSRYVDRKRRSAPPPIPGRRGVALPPQDITDPRVLRELAGDACERAIQRWSAAGLNDDTRLTAHPLLSDLPVADLLAVEPLMKPRSLPSGEVVIEQGVPGTSLYILVQGTAKVLRHTRDDETIHLATIKSGAFFGEMALLTDSPRIARVVCEGPVILFELAQRSLEDLAARSEKVSTVLGTYTRRRLLRNLMATSPLFRPLDKDRRDDLMELFRLRVLSPGDVVVSEGQQSEELFVVLTGAVTVSRQDDGEELTMAELGTGQIFGEISLIQRRTTTATVRAAMKTVILCLSRTDFNKHVSDFPEVLSHVYKMATEREETMLQLEQAHSVDIEDGSLLI